MGKKKAQDHDYQDIEYLKRGLNKARNKGDFKEVGNIHNQLGVLYRERKDFDAALEEHDEEIRITKKHFPGDKIALAIAYRGKAEVFIEMNNQEDAHTLVKEYLRLATEVDDVVEKQRAHVTLGRVYLGLANKYAEEDKDETRMKALQKSEQEFRKARELLNNGRVQSRQSEAGLMDMKCGVFINLAIVLELKGQLEESKQFFLKAIEIARKHSLFDHMYRSYLNLYDIYWKLGDHKESRAAAEEAGRAGKATGNSLVEAEAKHLEAKACFALDEIDAGVKLLKRIRNQYKKSKDQVCGEDLMNEIESLLKSGIRVRKTEDELDATAASNFIKRKQLHENLGDKYVALCAYAPAISHYNKAIECAENGIFDQSEVAKLYFSLAETYKDCKDYLNALKYLDKEIKIHEENPNEAFKTQTNITVIMELAKMNVDEIIDAHEKAINLSKLCNCPKKEVSALKNKASYFKTVDLLDEAAEIVKKYKEIQRLHNLSDEICESSQEVEMESDNDSIDLDNLSSDDDDSDEELPKLRTASKKKKRVNEKGETQLHIAAQKGDIKAVRRLIQEDRNNINARDSAGWTPLHEACNFGTVEVVEALLKSGAKVNDPGGQFCDKITPMHDAASNGHMDVMVVILKYNPNVLAKNAQGNFILDELINWKTREKNELDEESLQKYINLKHELKSRMAKAGYQYQPKDEARAKKKRRERSTSPKSMLLRGKHGTIPAKTVIDDFDPDSGDGAVDFYSSAMKELRGKSRRKETSNRALAELSDDNDDVEALIPESQNIGDDWLENDLADSKNQVKRKRDPMEDLRMIDRSLKRKKNGQKRRNDVARVDIVGDDQEDMQENECVEDFFDLTKDDGTLDSPSHDLCNLSFDEPTVIENTPAFAISDDDPMMDNNSPEIVIDSDSDESQAQAPLRRRIIQTKLPFKVIDDDSNSSSRLLENRFRTAPPANRSSQSKKIKTIPKTLRLKVRIGEKTLLVPVAQEHMTNNIEWLCVECQKRYAESSGLKPILTLSTTDGALLTGSDLLHDVLNEEEIELVGNILSVDLPRLPERFRNLLMKHPELCEPSEADGILQCFEICQSSNNLNLADFSLHGQLGHLVFQALKHQYDLKELILSECVLQDEGVKHLGMILPTLPCLTTLDLSCNGITAEGLQELLESFKKKPDIQINKSSSGLTSLNLSFNPLGNSAGTYITDLLLQFPQLKILLLADCDFNVRFLAESRIIDAFKKMSLEELDLSYNPLGPNGVDLFLKSMPPDQFNSLQIKTTSCFGGEL